MSFVIDESKVEELLKSSAPKYTVSIAPGGEVVDNDPSPYQANYMGVSGTVAFSSTTTSEEARRYLMSIRRKIEKSGSPLHNAAALTEEIKRMRSR